MSLIRPKLKHTSPVYGGGDTIYIGGYGQVTEIGDGDGAIRRLLDLLDGTRTISDVHRALAIDYPQVTEADVAAAIAQFDEARFLVNDAASADGVLTDYDLRRWERNVNFFGSYARLSDNKYEQQRKLRDCRIALVGLGGLGSHLLLDLAALGVGHLRVVEFDRLELSNLNRQILYREADIGQPKIELAVSRIKEFSPRLDIEAIPQRITGPDDVAAIAAGMDLLICVADRPKMEIAGWINEGCVRAGVPLVTGGLDTQRVTYYVMQPGQTGCVECWRLQVAREDPVSHLLLEEKRARQITGDNAAFVPLVAMTTALLLGDVVRVLTGVAPVVAAGRLMGMSFDDFVLREYERWERLADCPVCATVAAAEPLIPAS
jgi:molybdopterin/thiamine biosynthesis adenylyltransferase